MTYFISTFKEFFYNFVDVDFIIRSYTTSFNTLSKFFSRKIWKSDATVRFIEWYNPQNGTNNGL